MSKINWVNFYNKTSVKRDKEKEFGPAKIVGKNGSRGLVEEVQKHLRKGMKIIDIGCGTGHVLIDIYKTTGKKVKMIGIDYSPGMIKVARANSKGVKDISFILMDALKTRFRNNTFDIAINRLGANPESYKEAYRILKKNGLFFLFVTDKGDWKEVRNVFGFKGYFTSREQAKMLKEASFKILKILRFKSTSYYRDLETFKKAIEIVPFKPPFNIRRHAKKLKEYVRKYKTEWGIKSSQRRVIIISKK